jgi:hypothetical protein
VFILTSVTRSRVFLAGLFAGATLASVAIVGALVGQNPDVSPTPNLPLAASAETEAAASTAEVAAAVAPTTVPSTPLTEFVYPDGSPAPRFAARPDSDDGDGDGDGDDRYESYDESGSDSHDDDSFDSHDDDSFDSHDDDRF